MYEVEVVAHPGEGVAEVEVCLELSHFPECECLDGLVILLESLAHLRICLFFADGDQAGFDGLGDDLVLPDRQVHDAVSEVARVAAGVEQGDGAVVGHERPVVMGADEYINAFQALVEVKPLALED